MTKAEEMQTKLAKTDNKPAKLGIKGKLEAMLPAIEKALPKHLTAERFVRLAQTALRTTPKLAQCTEESILGCVMLCSQLGLEFNTPLGQAYIIPYEDRKNGVTVAQFQIGYKGLIDLFYRLPDAFQIFANVVYEKDDFDYEYGTNAHLKHIPTTQEEHGKITHIYAYAKFRDAFSFVVLTKKEALEAKKQSQGASSPYSPWNKFENEMLKKTAIKRLMPFLPKSIELSKATTMDNGMIKGITAEAEPEDDDFIDTEFSIEDNEPEATTQEPDFLDQFNK